MVTLAVGAVESFRTADIHHPTERERERESLSLIRRPFSFPWLALFVSSHFLASSYWSVFSTPSGAKEENVYIWAAARQGSREWVYATISNGSRQRRRRLIEPNYIIPPPLVDPRFSYACVCVWNCGKRRKWRKREREREKCFHS